MTHDTTHAKGKLHRKLPTVSALMLGVAAVAVMALFLAGLAFTLSFDALRALAIEINVRPGRAWMAPVAIDVAQAAATVGYVIFRVADKYTWPRRFCMTLAIATVTLSVVGNSFHSYQLAERNIARIEAGEDLGFIPQHPVIAAIIAAIFPLLWLALFHLSTMMVQVVADERTRLREAAAAQQPDGRIDVSAPSVQAVGESVPEWQRTATEVAATPVFVAASGSNTTPVASTYGIAVAIPGFVAPTDEGLVADLPREDQFFDGRTRTGYPQTREGLLRFLDESDFHETVKVVAAMLVTEPNLKQIEAAHRLRLDKSTVSRRWKLFCAAAEGEGFSVPPLPAVEVGEHVKATILA